MHLDCLQLRLYRIMVLFKGLELKVSISLMWVTLTRNFTVSLCPKIMFACHRLCLTPHRSLPLQVGPTSTHSMNMQELPCKEAPKDMQEPGATAHAAGGPAHALIPLTQLLSLKSAARTLRWALVSP